MDKDKGLAGIEDSGPYEKGIPPRLQPKQLPCKCQSTLVVATPHTSSELVDLALTDKYDLLRVLELRARYNANVVSECSPVPFHPQPQN